MVQHGIYYTHTFTLIFSPEAVSEMLFIYIYIPYIATQMWHECIYTAVIIEYIISWDEWVLNGY